MNEMEQIDQNNNEYDEYDEQEEDEWGTQEIVIDRSSTATITSTATSRAIHHEAHPADNDHDGGNGKVLLVDYNSDEYWGGSETYQKEIQSKTEEISSNKIQSNNHNSNNNNGDDAGQPMFVLDVTMLNPGIHSKYDKNSVNDPIASSKLRREVERNFDKYANDTTLISNGAILPCGASVWKGALVRMRDERKGHYFLPIFPPPK